MTDAKDNASRAPTEEPQIAGSLVNGVRGTLIRDGRWERIEADVLARGPELAAWLLDAERAEWVSLEGYLAFLEALRAILGDEALAALGSLRLREDVDVGRLSPMLRSWLREFNEDPRELLRVAPYAWQGVTRHAGRMEVVASDAEVMRLRVAAAPQVLLETRAWHIFLEGFGAELLRQSGRQGSFSIGPDGASLSLEARWSDEASEGGADRGGSDRGR